MNHYFTHADIMHSIVEGVEVPALCGEWTTVRVPGASQSMPGHELADREREICKKCSDTFNGLPLKKSARKDTSSTLDSKSAVDAAVGIEFDEIVRCLEVTA